MTLTKLFSLSAVTTALLASPLLVQAQDASEDDLLTVYGKINVSAQRNDEGYFDAENELVSNNSRIGFKGDMAIENGLEVFYLLEWQVDVTDSSGGDNVTSRNQYVGIRGGFGEVMAGRRDTVLKSSQGSVDLFSDYEGDIKALFEGENRTSDTITYFTPNMAGFKAGVSYIFSESEAIDDGVSLSLGYGDSKLQKSDYYLAAAVDSEVDGYDVVRFSGQTKFNTTKVGLMYQSQELVDGSQEADGFLVSAAQPWNNFTFKAQVQMMDFETGDDTSFAAGVDYKLGAKTKVYTWYTERDLETFEVDQSYFAIGLEHNF